VRDYHLHPRVVGELVHHILVIKTARAHILHLKRGGAVGAGLIEADREQMLDVVARVAKTDPEKGVQAVRLALATERIRGYRAARDQARGA